VNEFFIGKPAVNSENFHLMHLVDENTWTRTNKNHFSNENELTYTYLLLETRNCGQTQSLNFYSHKENFRILLFFT